MITKLTNLIKESIIKNNWHFDSLIISILVKEGLERLGIFSALESGYYCYDIYALWHCYVSVEGLNVDISDISDSIDILIKNPTGRVKINQGVEDMLNLYVENKDAFWKHCKNNMNKHTYGEICRLKHIIKLFTEHGMLSS